MHETNQKIGALIHSIREERGLTQAEFAEKLGTSQSAVNRIEHGKQNLSLETVARISDVLHKQIISLSGKSVNLRIEGGHQLRGTVTLKTSKNAMVAVLCASLLNKGVTRIRNVPQIEEVNRIVEVLESIGVQIKRDEGNGMEIKVPPKLDITKIDEQAAKKTRVVILLAGALMHDYSEFKIPYSGGCNLGKRSILPHIYTLEEFGVKFKTLSGRHVITSNPTKPKRTVVLYESGDTTTENALLAAARIPAETRISMASANYMVQDLCIFLQKLGVKIEGIGTTELKVTGVKNIKKNITFSPSEDPVEAMTFIAAAITTNSAIKIKRAPIKFLQLELLKLEKMGLKYDVSNSYKSLNGFTDLVDIKIHKHNGSLVASEEKIYGRPYPGVNIDHVPYFVPIAAMAKGRTLIHDWTYEGRALMYTEVKKLGADIELADPHRVFIEGPTEWKPADIVTPSGLRPASLLLVGMMAAPGISKLRDVYTINRGYEDLAKRLNSLGARITVLYET